MKGELIDRFVLKTRKGAGGCIIWQARRDPSGYGRIKANGKCAIAHRVSYELFVGPVPEGLFVLHDCPSGDNPGCVNPTHLWLGTLVENNEDRDRKGRQRTPRGAANGGASGKLTDNLVALIRQEAAGGRAQTEIAREHGVTKHTIWAIVHRKIWRHLP